MGRLCQRWAKFTWPVIILATTVVAAPAWAAQLTLSWVDNASDESGFRIERRVSPSGNYAEIAVATANTSTYADGTVTEGQSYCYRVRSYNGSGSSAYSNEACGTVAATPPPPPVTAMLTVTRAGTGAGSVSGSGINCGTDCTESVTAGTPVTLTAAATSGSTFAGWTGGGCSGSAASCTVTVSTATTVTATFNTTAPASYLLTVTRNGTGTGTVSGTGISCGTDCSQSVTTGTPVTLTAAATSGSTFAGWTGGGCSGSAASCTVTVSTATTVTATFNTTAPASYLLTVTRSGTGTGTVSGTGISCGTDCSQSVATGTQVTLSALAASGSAFAGWSGACSGTASACTVTVSANTAVGAAFQPPSGTAAAGGLVAAFGFNEGSGTSVVDSSGNGHTGAISGATWTPQGRFGQALAFNGVNDWVTVNATSLLNLTNSMTLEAWVFPTSTTGVRDVVVKEGSGVDIYNLYARNWNGLPEANVFVGGVNRTAEGAVLPANIWTHLAGTYDGSVARLFVNGVQVASATVGGAISTSTGPLRIGGNSVWGEFFAGRIDEIRVYSRALSASEIQSDMNTPVGGGTVPSPVMAMLTVSRTGSGAGSVTGSGISCGTDCTEAVTAGSQVTLSAAAASGSTFAGWSGGGCSGSAASCAVTVSTATTVTATFALPSYTLTASKAGTGTVTGTRSGATVISCGSDCTETVPAGTAIVLSATPTAGATFSGWSGGGCTGTGACTVTVSAATTVTATFALPSYTLAASKAGTGTVTGTRSGATVISCGSDCTETVPAGTAIVLSATPTAGATFSGWAGGGCSGSAASCTVTVSAATTVTATFNAAPASYTLTITRNGTGTGSVTGTGIDCGTDCSQSVTSGSQVTLGALASGGSTFAGWSGACNGSAAACTVTISANTVVGATFEAAGSSSTVAIVTGSGPGSPPRVRGFTTAGTPTSTDFLAFGSSFTGGVFVAVGRPVSGGDPMIVAGSGPGISAEVRIFRLNGASIGSGFRPYGNSFRGGVRLAVCDVDGDGVEEIVTVPGSSSSPTVAIWKIAGNGTATRMTSFQGSTSSRTPGHFVACGDLTGDGRAEVIVGFDQGSAPRIRVFSISGNSATLLAVGLVYDPSFTGGVRVATADVDGDGLAEVLVAPGPGGPPVVRALKISGATISELTAFEAEDPSFDGGLFVAGGNIDELGAAVIVTPGPGGPPQVHVFSVTPSAALHTITFTGADATSDGGLTVGAAR